MIRNSRGNRSGFTLIEILVVIVVIAILATLVAPNVFRHVGSAKDATGRSQIEMFGAALDAYRLDNGRYPPERVVRPRPRPPPPGQRPPPQLRAGRGGVRAGAAGRSPAHQLARAV